MHNSSPADSNTKTPAEPHIELLPPTLSLRIGKRRLTLSRRPRKLASHLLHGLLRRSWRALFGKALRVSLAAAAVSAAWNSVALAAAPPVNTLPTGGTIVAGSATMAQTANTLTINQTSSQAIGNFTSFSIGANASVIINEPNSAAAFLARVTGTDPSQLYGLLQSNGTVMLINQNGILVGPSGVVDVARFIASTINISDSDFLAGRLTFANSAGTSGTVENQGLIKTASGGSVYLIGSNVSNSGIIHSPGGEVILAAGESVQLVDTGTPGVTVNITGAAGNVTNLGTITAEAGTIGIAAGLINNSGSINASSAVAEGGRVFLRASNSLTTTATSTIAADGATNGGSVVLYSAGASFIDGNVSATGATGTGGYVETSGLTSLDVVNAPTIGAGGTWYIDPYDLVVADTTSGGTTISGSGPYAIYSCGSVSTISAACISSWLSADLNVTLATTGDPGSGGNITVNSAITKSAGSHAVLTLDADDNIYINANITSTSGVLDLNLVSNYHGYNDASGIQSIVLSGATVALNGGVLNVSDGYSGLQQGNLTITNGGVLNLSYNGIQATQGGSVYTGNLSVDATSSVLGLANSGTYLIVSGTYTNNGSLALANLSMANVTDFVNNGNAILNAMTLNSSGVSNAGTLTLTNASLNVSGNTVDNTGTFNITNSMIQATSFINEAGGTVNANYLSNFSAAVNNGGIMTLDSTANKPTGYAADTTITLVQGLTNGATGTLTMLGTVTNNGNITNSVGGNITVGTSSVPTTVNGGGWDNHGNLTLASGSTLSGGELDNEGYLAMNNANLSFIYANNNAGGTLSGTGTINASGGALMNDGTLSPGGTGTVGSLTIVGGYAQGSSGSLLLDVASASSYDQIAVTGSIALDGTLQTTLLSPYVPAINTPFQPFGDNNNVSGSFRHVIGDVITNSSGGLEMIKALNVGATGNVFYMVMCGSADINFSGNGGSSWSNISNWSTGYFPTAIDNVSVSSNTELDHIASDGTDIVRSINLSNNATLYVSGGNVTANNIAVDGTSYLTIAAGTVQTVNLSANGSVTVGQIESELAATLNISGTANLSDLTLNANGQVISTNSASVINVTGNVADFGGSINSTGSVILVQTSDQGDTDLTVGNITAANLVLQSQAGAIMQGDEGDVLHVTNQLVTSSDAGTTLGNTGNQIAAYSGINTGSGDIVLFNSLNPTDTSVVTITGITNRNGSIRVDNTGAMKTAASASTGSAAVDTLITSLGMARDGSVTAATTASSPTAQDATVTLATHSPLTIGGNVTANGNIALNAGDGTSVTDILAVNGNVSSAVGAITLGAHQTLYGAGATLSDINGTRTPVPLTTSTGTNTSSGATDTSSITTVASNLISSVNDSQSTNTSDSTRTPSGNTSSGSTFVSSDGQTMTTGGDANTFGGSDSSDSNEQQSDGTQPKPVAKLYCS